LKKATLAFMILVVALIFSAFVPANLKRVKANGDYVIERVDQNLQIMYNGYVLMNETVQLSGQTPNSFVLGFPYPFGSYIVNCFAFELSNPSNIFPVSLNEPVEDRSGYYGIRVDFSGAAPQVFTIDVLFSNKLIVQDSQNASLYTLVFPVFPSMTQNVNTFNGSITLPKNAEYVDGTIGNVPYTQENLTALAFNSSALTFLVQNNEMQLLDVDQLGRDITINEFETVMGSDTYYVTNKGTFSINSMKVWVPIGASNIAADDQLGRTMSVPTQVEINTNRYFLNLTRQLDSGYSTKFILHYTLPRDTYLKKQGSNFVVNMTLFQDFDYYVNDTSVTFVLPEGAKIQALSDTSNEGSLDLHRDVFQETVTFSKQSVIALESFSVEIGYEYSSIWVAFRPTTWVMVITMIGVIAVIVMRRPKAPTPASVSAAGMIVRPEQLRSFVDMYEERMKIFREMDSLEDKAHRGRIPRQRYKVQRKTLETRLESSSRNLEELKGRIRSGGSHYASLMRELEVAEAQLDDVEANVKTIEGRHSHGELSLEAYRKLRGDYEQRKQKAETTMNGILLRLREEIR
jgi:hypothetical protein